MVGKNFKVIIYLKKVRELEKAGYTEIMIAKFYKISRQHFWRIRRDKEWKRKYAKNNKI